MKGRIFQQREQNGPGQDWAKLAQHVTGNAMSPILMKKSKGGEQEKAAHLGSRDGIRQGMQSH